MQRFCLLIAFMLLFSKLRAGDTIVSYKNWHKTFETTTLFFRKAVNKNGWFCQTLEVYDARPETKSLGLYVNGGNNPSEIVADVSLDSLFKANIKTSDSCLIVVRNMWLNSVSPNIQKWRYKLTFTADIFLKKETGYAALVQVDTTFLSKEQMWLAAPGLMNNAFRLLQAAIEKAILSKRWGLKRIPIETITGNYKQRLQLVAVQTSPFPRGIYYTWNDFKANHLAKKDFSFRQTGKEPSVLFVKEKNEEIFTKDAYAVSDGKTMYKMDNGFLFPMYINNTSIYWMGFKNFRVNQGGAPIAVPMGGGLFVAGLQPTGASIKVKTMPCLLNPETGEAY